MSTDSYEPINIFSCRIDPRGVLEVLRRSGFEVRVEGPDDDWSEAVVTLKKGGLFRKPRVMTFGHRSAYYDGDDWPRQIMGMQGYFSRAPESATKLEMMRIIGSFRFALSVPQYDLDIDSTDDRLQLLYAVCQHLDGVIFTPSGLRDARGRILLGLGEVADPAAVMPRLPRPSASPENEDEAAVDDDNDEPSPPTPARVARRALALTAVAARATLELDAPQLQKPDNERLRMLTWIEELGIGDELEPDEWKVLQRPVGKLDQRAFIDSMWRVEGLTVLAWALGRFDIPPDDVLVIPPDLYQAMGLFDADDGRALLGSPQLRSPEELESLRQHLLMFHWRVRNYGLRPEAMDFVAFSKDCWFGTFDITTFRIIDNDLAIGDAAIDDADPEQVGIAQSIAMERHLAINWLCGDATIYSETDTST